MAGVCFCAPGNSNGFVAVAHWQPSRLFAVASSVFKAHSTPSVVIQASSPSPTPEDAGAAVADVLLAYTKLRRASAMSQPLVPAVEEAREPSRPSPSAPQTNPSSAASSATSSTVGSAAASSAASPTKVLSAAPKVATEDEVAYQQTFQASLQRRRQSRGAMLSLLQTTTLAAESVASRSAASNDTPEGRASPEMPPKGIVARLALAREQASSPPQSPTQGRMSMPRSPRDVNAFVLRNKHGLSTMSEAVELEAAVADLERAKILRSPLSPPGEQSPQRAESPLKTASPLRGASPLLGESPLSPPSDAGQESLSAVVRRGDLSQESAVAASQWLDTEVRHFSSG